MAQSKEVYLEFHKQGNYVKVCAICAQTGIEVSIVGDAKASRRELETVAVNKLRYVLNKKANP